MSDDELLRQLVDEAWKKALPMIRQRLGSEPERERLDLRARGQSYRRLDRRRRSDRGDEASRTASGAG